MGYTLTKKRVWFECHETWRSLWSIVSMTPEKCPRKQTNEDFMKMLLIPSDPVISSIRHVKTSYSLPTEALNLLEEPDIISDEDEK